MWRGSPKYLYGKGYGCCWSPSRGWISIPSHRIGYTSVLLRLVRSPLAFPKVSRIAFRAAISCGCGLMNIAVSSAYNENLKRSQLLCRKVMSPCCCTYWNNLCRGSIASRDSIGDRGSPCLTPPHVQNSSSRLPIQQKAWWRGSPQISYPVSPFVPKSKECHDLQ